MNELHPPEKKYDVGVIIGRFQVPELHDSHLKLFEYVMKRHSKVICLLGCSAFQRTRRNPLDYHTRAAMISAVYGHSVLCVPVYDMPDDESWSDEVDSTVKRLTFCQSVILYGSRDSFIDHYSGNYPTQLLESDSYLSGTSIREATRTATINSPAFRAGVIWGTLNQYPRVIPTVDVAVLNEDKTKVLLVRKPDETTWRFIGGFADPRSDSYEKDARREVSEEVGIEIADLKQIGSANIPDWRMAGETDVIRTTFFTAKYVFGTINPQDDIEEARWFDLKDVEAVIMTAHIPLLVLLDLRK